MNIPDTLPPRSPLAQPSATLDRRMQSLFDEDLATPKRQAGPRGQALGSYLAYAGIAAAVAFITTLPQRQAQVPRAEPVVYECVIPENSPSLLQETDSDSQTPAPFFIGVSTY